MTIPALPDLCWPIDEACCAGFTDLDLEVQDRAIALATSTIRMLTGYRVGGCPRKVRPCAQHCAVRYTGSWVGDSWVPVNVSGTWFNMPCGCGESGCLPAGGLRLPPPVGAITEVRIDGEVLDPADYYIADGNLLARTDGQAWPTENDISQPDTEVGTWSVTYLNAYPVDGLGSYAAGILACEFAKACSGDNKCRLPKGTTDVIRGGIAITVTPGMFPEGFTGINEVDAYIRQWNPYGLKVPPTVWYPGMNSQVTTRG